MSEQQAPYKTINSEVDDAMEMLSKGYERSSLEIHPQTTVIRRRGWEMVEEVIPAFVKISTSFKAELKDLSPIAFKVWGYLALSVNRNTEQAHPGIRTVARDTNLAQNTVIAAIKELEEKGLMTVTRGERKYNIYEFPLYVSANKKDAKTASPNEAVNKTASVNPQTASVKDETASELLRLNQRNQSNQINTRALSKEKTEEANQMVDAILEGARRAQSSWPGREKIPEPIRDLLDVYVQLTGQKPVKDQLMDWLGAGNDWMEAGIVADDLRQAYAKSKPDQYGRGGFMVNRPGSLTRTAQMFTGERRNRHANMSPIDKILANISAQVR